MLLGVLGICSSAASVPRLASFPSPILPPFPQNSVACGSACDDIYAEMWELKIRMDVLWYPYGCVSRPLFSRMMDEMYSMASHQFPGLAMMCAQTNDNQNCNVGCYVATGNSTRFSPERQAVTCEKVPFRHLAHVITSYALNGSDMYTEIKGVPPAIDSFFGGGMGPQVLGDMEQKIFVPNSWFVQTALSLHHAINALPAIAWHALKLNESTTGPAAPPDPPISEVFAKLLTDNTRKYIMATAASWQWAPPPTPLPCPGGSLQECMNLCSQTPADVFKACLQTCLDVCHTSVPVPERS